MEASYRLFSGMAAGAAALVAPAAPLVACTAGCIAVDFAAGIAASRTTARRAGRRWYFESCEAWRTVQKLALASTAIVMAAVLDGCMEGIVRLELARLFAGFTCGVELWSFLENAAVVSRAPLFRRLGVYVDNKLKRYEDKQRNPES